MSAALAVALFLSAQPEAIRFPQAVDRSLKDTPAMRIAELDVDRALALVGEARAPSLPTLYASGSFTHLDHERVVGTNVAIPRDSVNATLTLSVPLIAPNRWAVWWRAYQSAVAQRATSDDVRRQVALFGARSWLTVLGQKRVLAAAVLARDTSKAHLDFAKQRRQGGVGNRLDEVRAAQELAVAQTQLENAAAGLVRVQEALGVAIGADVALDAVDEEPDLGLLRSESDALNGVPTRLDVKAAQVRDDVAKAQTRVDWADYLPILALLAQPIYQNPPLLTQPLNGWQVQAVLTLPLYDGSLRYEQAKERRAVAKQTDAQLEQTLRQAKSEVRGAFDVLTHTDDALKAARDAAVSAKEALELATLAYAGGIGTNLDVIDAERRFRDAETAAAVAEDASRQARLDLLAAAGRFP
jgi:outer membrane protein TolC